MAIPVAYQTKIGMFVYPHMNPMRAGIVVAVHEMGNYPPCDSGPYKGFISERPAEVTIKYLDGTAERRSTLGLKDFRSLIADHERKLATHHKTLAKLEAL
jgi:hypothetical protein